MWGVVSMKNSLMMSIASVLLAGSAINGMNFEPGDQVILLDGGNKGEVALVSSSFSKKWPGERISNHTSNKMIAAYLQQIPLSIPVEYASNRLSFIAYKGLKGNHFGEEKYIYLVSIGSQTVLTHCSWMKKIIQNASGVKTKNEQKSVNAAGSGAAAKK